jgi:hypothetical protein
MFTRNVGRAARVAALVGVVAAAPMMAAAQGGTGSSGPTGPSGSSGGSTADTGTGHMPQSPAAMQKMKPSELYNMMDKDKDGYVTKEEFLKFQERVFDSWDKNKTGRLGAVMFTDQG